MAGKKREDIQERDITGLKYFATLAPLLKRLRSVGCARDKAGNRKLHYDQYCMLLLLISTIRWSRRCGRFNKPAN